MTISINGITGATSNETVTTATLTRSTFDIVEGPSRDAQTKELVAVYSTSPTNGSDAVWFSAKSFEGRNGSRRFKLRLSATVVDDSAAEGEVAEDEIAGTLILETGRVAPTIADLRLFLSSLISLTYASVSSNTPETTVLAKIANGKPKLY